MNSFLLGGFAWGVLFGLLYFGGLWLTVQMVTTKNKPQRFFLWSFIGRSVALLGGIWLTVGPDPAALLALTAGFLGVRVCLTKLLGSKKHL